MSTLHSSTHPQLPSQLGDDEIDISQVAASLYRQKIWIGGITIAAALISAFYAFTRKPVWEGRFQIVLDDQNKGSGGRLAQLAAANPMLAGLAGVSGGKSSLETEVKILESPSVLKPVYEFVKGRKAAAGSDVSGWIYTKWANTSLDIELIKGTSILSVAYRDADESLILPVLRKITNTYQTYSGKDRRRGLNQGIDYLKQEIEKLGQQSAASMRAAQAYALANGLGIQDGMPAASGDTNGGSVEASREAAQNEVNALRQRIDAAQSAGETTLYKAPQFVANSSVYSQLQQLETELQRQLALLTPQDQSIQRLQRERRGLIAYINRQTVGLLQGELITAEAQLASLTRPREVMLKHRELVRAALRDEKTLAELEVQLQSLKLDQARQTDPWELISTPTVMDQPVAPRKKRVVALGLLSGLVMGCGAAIVRDRRSGLVFSQDELMSLLPCPLIRHLPAMDGSTWSDAVDLLAAGPLAKAPGNSAIALIPIGNIPNEQLQAFSTELNRAIQGRELLVSTDLRQTSQCGIQLLVTSKGVATRTQLSQLREKLALQATPLAGWVLLDPDLNLG